MIGQVVLNRRQRAVDAEAVENLTQTPTAIARADELRTKARELEAEAERFERGYAGEARTGELLLLLPLGFAVLADCRVPGSKANIDHVVVGPTGVILIDTKNYSGRVSTGKGTLWHNRRPMRREIEAQHRYVRAVQQLLPQSIAATVRAVLCIREATMSAPTLECDGVVAVPGSSIADLVTSGPALLTAGQVDEVVESLLQTLLPTDVFRGEAWTTPDSRADGGRSVVGAAAVSEARPALSAPGRARASFASDTRRVARSPATGPRASTGPRHAAVKAGLVLAALALAAVVVPRSGQLFAAAVNQVSPAPAPTSPPPAAGVDEAQPVNGSGWMTGSWSCRSEEWVLTVSPPPGISAQWSTDGERWAALPPSGDGGSVVPIGPADRVVLIRSSGDGGAMASTSRPRSGCS